MRTKQFLQYKLFSNIATLITDKELLQVRQLKQAL